MFGLLFVMPQYFGAVLGADAFGTGLRLLPLIGGLLVGAQLADRLKVPPPRLVATGFALIAASLFAGATTSATTDYTFAAIWMATLGAGLGFAIATRDGRGTRRPRPRKEPVRAPPC